jgi:hypothetical protein
VSETRVIIYDAPFSPRTLGCLNRSGCWDKIEYLDELVLYSAEDLLQRPSVGRFTIREVRKVLATYGLALRGDMLLDSEAEKKLIQAMPETIREIINSLRDLERKIKHMTNALDQLHCNMQPLK